MNKLTKGSIAAGAGLVLLLGGAGTFMQWNDGETINGGTVTAGLLSLSEPANAQWTLENGDTVEDIASYRIVPGDTLIYSADLVLTAEGANLVADLKLPENAIASDDTALAKQLKDSAVLELTTDDLRIVENEEEGVNSYTITPGDGRIEEPVAVNVRLEFPKDVTLEDGDAMGQTVSLDNMHVSLEQRLATETVGEGV